MNEQFRTENDIPNEEGIISKATFIMPKEDVKIEAISVYTGDPVSYRIWVTYGYAEPSVAVEGEIVTIIADDPEWGYEFDHWEVYAGDITIDNIYDSVATFVMPDEDVELGHTENYIYIPEYAPSQLDVIDGYAESSYLFYGGETAITANDAPKGKDFFKWEVLEGDVIIYNEHEPFTYLKSSRHEQSITVRAVFKDYHDITVLNGTASSASAIELEDISITADEAPTGKEFDRWEVVSGNVMTANQNDMQTNFLMPDESVTIKATYKDIAPSDEYSITVINGKASADKGKEGDSISITANPAPEGKVFERWECVPLTYKDVIEDAENASTSFTMLDKDVAFKAVYTDNTAHAVTVTNGAANPVTAVKGEEIMLTAGAAPVGKVFDKWTVMSGKVQIEDIHSVSTSFVMPNEDVELMAEFKDIEKYTVSFDMGGHGDQVGDQTIEKGTIVKKPADPTASGWTFGGWYADTTFTTAFDFNTEIKADTTVYAKWTENTTPPATTYTVTFNMNGHGNQIAAQTVNEGAKATKPADPTAEGWTFDGWYADATFSTAFDFNTAINADTTIYAKWTENTTPPATTYTVTFNMNGHGNQIAAQTVNEGAKATKPADPTASGWTFGGWYADATFSAGFDFNTAINADTTIYAKWTENTTPPATTYTIIAGMGGEWTKGSTTGLAFTSDAPFDKFDSVKVDGSTIAAANYTAEAGSSKITLAPAYLETLSVGSHSIVVVSTDGTASTNFTVKSASVPPVPTTYTVTFNMNGHGTQITAQSVESGSKATKPADPKASGYTFGGWYADATCSTKFDFNTAITANTMVYAKWAKNSVAPADPTTPQTGDNSNMLMWIALLFVSGGALAGTAIYGKKKKYRAE